MTDYKNLTDEELKKEFLKYFDEEKWDEIDITSKLDKLEIYINNKYLKLDYIPIIFDDIKQESKYDNKLDTIIINKNYLYKFDVAIRLMLIELRHAYQIKVLKNMESTNIDILKIQEELKNDSYPKDYNDIKVISDYLYQLKEIDKFSFMLLILKELFDFEYHYPEVIYDELIHQYAKKSKEILLNLK